MSLLEFHYQCDTPSDDGGLWVFSRMTDQSWRRSLGGRSMDAIIRTRFAWTPLELGEEGKQMNARTRLSYNGIK